MKKRSGARWMAVALILVGCGGGEPGEGASASEEVGARIEACDLLTEAEIETALGKAVGEPFRDTQDGYDSEGTSLVTVCNRDAGGFMDGVSVTVRQFATSGDAQTSEQYAASAKADLDRQKADPEQAPYVTDIKFSPLDFGVHAAVLMDWGDYVVVQVYRNGTAAVQVSVSAPRADIAESLARAAMTRVPD